MRVGKTVWPALAVLLVSVVVQHTAAEGPQKHHPHLQQLHQLERTNERLIHDDDPGDAAPLTDAPLTDACNATDEEEAQGQIELMEATLHVLLVDSQEASWLENTDHSEANTAAANEAYSKYSLAYNEWWGKVIHCYQYQNFTDDELKRRFELQATPGTTVLSEEDQNQFNTDISNMNAAALEKICPYDKMDSCSDDEKLSIDDLEVILASERDPDALVYYWEEWRDTAGAPIKDDFIDYVNLLNKAALADGNGFDDASEMWLQPYATANYTTDDFKSDIEDLWEDLKGLYEKLQGFVRHRLRTKGPYEGTFSADSPIPAHLLGNMWAQSWENIYDLVVPYEEVDLLDITDALEANIEDEKEMFGYAEDFFVQTGLFELTPDFWNKSMFRQPDDAIAVCHASAWDFLSLSSAPGVGPRTDGDFRIKMCTDKNQEDFIVIHHEMGHTQYQMAYSQEPGTEDEVPPLIFRDGANPGFHEAIGDTIALSVSTPSHLQLLYENITGEPYESTTEIDKRNINQLMKTALAKIAFLPYAYILDQFRWKVFDGEYPLDEMNYWWWDLRVKVQGVKPPTLRHKGDDFDPGCKFHVANGVPYIRYFVAHILQFQFHQRLCEVGNITGNVFECDIYGNPDSGAALMSLLERGASVPWTDQLRDFMGTEEGLMNASSIVAYFKPLEDYLDERIEEEGIQLKWDEDIDKYFVADIPATVPIVVGVVLAVMIVVVIVAYFVGKKRQDKKEQNKVTEVEGGQTNPSFDMNERKPSSSSSSSSSSAGS